MRVGSPFCMFCMSKLHLTRYIQGWLTYYRYADMKTFIISANKGITADSGCIFGRAGNESALALRTYKDVAYRNGRRGNGRTRAKDIGG